MKTVLALFALAILGYVVGVAVMAWRKQTGTAWERVLGTANESATILWSKLVAIIGVLIGGLDFVADYLEAPDVKSTLQSMVNPKYVGGFVLGVALITIAARLRSLKS